MTFSKVSRRESVAVRAPASRADSVRTQHQREAQVSSNAARVEAVAGDTVRAPAKLPRDREELPGAPMLLAPVFGLAIWVVLAFWLVG